MLLEQLKKNEPQLSKLRVDWGVEDLERLNKNKVVLVLGISPDWVYQQFISDSKYGRFLYLDIISYCKIPVLDSPYVELSASTEEFYSSKKYIFSSYVCDPCLPLVSYYHFLDAVSEKLKVSGYSVFKLIKKHEQMSLPFGMTNTDLTLVVKKPEFVESFAKYIKDAAQDKDSDFMLLDMFPENLRTLGYRATLNNLKDENNGRT